MNNNNSPPARCRGGAHYVSGFCLSWGINQVSIKLTLPRNPAPFTQADRALDRRVSRSLRFWATRPRRCRLTVPRRHAGWRHILAGRRCSGFEFPADLSRPAIPTSSASRRDIVSIYTAPFIVAPRLGLPARASACASLSQWLGYACALSSRGLVVRLRHSGCCKPTRPASSSATS